MILRGTCTSVLPFSKLNKMCFGYFDPENIFLDNENNKFRGDLTGNSAKKEALVHVAVHNPRPGPSRLHKYVHSFRSSFLFHILGTGMQ